MTQIRTDVYRAYKRSDGSPVDFPVTWQDPDDAALVWRWASDHFPMPATPLAYDLVKDMVGMTRSYAYFGGVTRIMYIHHHGYGFGPLTFLPPEGETAAYHANVGAEAPHVTELWTKTWWPQIEAESRLVRDEDYSGLDLRQSVERLLECYERYDDHYELMMRASRLVRPPREALLAFLKAHFEEDAEGLATTLLSGVDNISLQASGELWELAQDLKGRPDLSAALDTPQELASMPDGAEFWSRFQAWLDRHGHRNSTFEEVAEPTWAENPTVPISIMRGHAAGTPDPREGQRREAARRFDLQARLEGRLSANEDVAEFRRLVDLALPYSSVRESRPYASCISRAALRVPALAIGRNLAADFLIADPEDVFFLHLAELQELAAQGANARSQRPLVAARRADHAFWRSVVPPIAIGAVEEAEVAPGGWTGRGVAASAGVTEGRARVILDLNDANAFEAGDILVTVSTSPLWTALFGLASAVVTDSGGMLSHSSIVAREHHIPAVVGVRGSTQRIKTGDRLLVNGTEGRVEVLSAD